MPRLLLAALLLVFVAPAWADEDRLRVRVVTINAWGLPYVTPSREARIEALGESLQALKPDVVLLQEVWLAEDGERLAAALEEAGLPHHVHFDEGFLGSGLVIASTWPIDRAWHDAFELAGKPHKPYHGDFYARKGVTQAVLSTPVGKVTVATTHLHAGYGGEEYELIKVAQALQGADFLGDHGLRPPVAGDAVTAPLILGGDLNCRRGSLPFRLLTARAALTPVDAELGIDWVLTRAGGALEVRVLEVERVLGEDVTLSDATQRPVSDHEGVLAVLELRRRPSRTARGRLDDWRRVAAEALPLVEAELTASAEQGGPARRGGMVLLLFSLALFVLLWKVKGRGRWVIALTALALIHIATWRVYVGFVYEPMLQAGLQNARTRLLEGS